MRGKPRGIYMKRLILSADAIEAKAEKNRNYNLSQTQVGHPLKTLKGSTIKRSSKYGVGKEIGGQIYAHKNYIDQIVPADFLNYAYDELHKEYPNFQYNCFRWDPKKQELAFQEAPDFDTAREPVVGSMIVVTPDNIRETRYFKQIWHHKWLWVTNDYTGFDVAESWEWSKEWLSTLAEPADGSNQENWISQLSKYNLS